MIMNRLLWMSISKVLVSPQQLSTWFFKNMEQI